MKHLISQDAIEKTAETQMKILRQARGGICTCGVCGGSGSLMCKDGFARDCARCGGAGLVEKL